MDYNAVKYSVEDSVALITLNKPESLNALDDELKADLAKAILAARDDEDVRAVVITGSGRAFCAGGNLDALLQVKTTSTGRERMKKNYRWLLDLINLEKPVIAAVNGYAVGGGCNMALACDLIIAAEDAQFSQIFCKIGLIPDLGGAYFLPRLIGPARAKEMVFSGRMVGAAEAERIGLINKVVPTDKLLDEAVSMARKFAKGPTKALGLAKVLINKSLGWELDTSLENEALAQALCLQTEDFKEGATAFKEKRPPVFRGR